MSRSLFFVVAASALMVTLASCGAGSSQTGSLDRSGDGWSVRSQILHGGKQEGVQLITIDSGTMQIDVIPTGSIALDLALGVGGVPRGRITEIFGPESSGKTTVCQHILAEAQRLGGVVAVSFTARSSCFFSCSPGPLRNRPDPFLT